MVKSRFSLRALSLASIILFGLLVVGHGAALLWASRGVWHSVQDIERDIRSVDATHELDRTLREYHRLGNLWAATREPEIQTARTELESSLRGLTVQVDDYVGDELEQRLLGALDKAVTAYLTASERAIALEMPPDQLVRTLRPPFEHALASSAALRQQNEVNRRESQRSGERALRMQGIVTITSGLVLVLGLMLVAISVRRFVLRPILTLQAAIEHFRAGEAREKPSRGALAEMRDLTERFNEMADAIEQQRRDQLTFLAAVAHDLRNPLSGLKMIVQSLERDPDAATPDRYRRLDRQLDRLARMVGDLLDATRIESGHLELHLEDLDVCDAARTMVDLYAPTTTTHEITLKAPARPLIIHGDPLRIEQVVSNLLSNAIKYSPRGGPIEVSLAAGDGEAVLAVSDRGLGIPPEEIPSLFMPFRRPSMAEPIPGVGLGLSIVQRIVRAHGGRIEVESVPSVGSTFRVRLPMAPQAGRDVPRPSSGEPELPEAG